MKCISIKEKHIEVPGEERRERCERREGGTGCETVCESMRVIERGRGDELNCIWQGKKGGRKKERRGECFHLLLLEKHLILGQIRFRKGVRGLRRS